MKKELLAHVKPDDSGGWIIHSLEEHLYEVGKISAEMAERFFGGDWAKIAGLWHGNPPIFNRG